MGNRLGQTDASGRTPCGGWAPEPKGDCPRRLPVIRIRGRLYYQDDRLQEFRAVDDPCERVPFDAMLWALAILGKWPA